MIDTLMLQAVRRGSERALGQVIDKYNAYVCVIIRNAAGNALSHEDVEEVASDVFFALWENAERCDNLKSYIGAIAVFDLPIDKPIVSADSAEQDLSGASVPENAAIDPPLAPDMRSIDWLNATPVESTIKVLTATADGEIIFTFDFYGGGGTVSALFDDCFKDDVKAAIVHISTTTDAEGNDSSYAIRFSLDVNGVITGAVVTVE